jgi:hypothetical protein
MAMSPQRLPTFLNGRQDAVDSLRRRFIPGSAKHIGWPTYGYHSFE